MNVGDTVMWDSTRARILAFEPDGVVIREEGKDGRIRMALQEQLTKIPKFWTGFLNIYEDNPGDMFHPTMAEAIRHRSRNFKYTAEFCADGTVKVYQ